MSNEERSLSPINLDPNSWFDRYMEAWLEENFERFAENWQAKRARDDRYRKEIEEFFSMWTNKDIGTVIYFAGNNNWFSFTAWEKVSETPGMAGWKNVSHEPIHQKSLKLTREDDIRNRRF